VGRSGEETGTWPKVLLTVASSVLACLGVGQSRLVRVLRRQALYGSSLGARQAVRFYAAQATRQPRIALRVPGLDRDLFCRTRDSDCLTLCNVFGELDAEIPVEIAPNVIVDGGANAGYVSVYYANRYPTARIIAIEPDRGNFELARENCAPYRNVEVIHAGLWSHDTTLEIHDPRMGWRSWAYQTHEADHGVAEGIDGISIPTLLRRIGEDRIDVLKLDIEGAEEQLVSSGSVEWLADVRVVLVETHGDEAERAVSAAMRRASFAELNTAGHRHVFVNPALRRNQGQSNPAAGEEASRAAPVPS
jgi:FkbM family methyltransferase